MINLENHCFTNIIYIHNYNIYILYTILYIYIVHIWRVPKMGHSPINHPFIEGFSFL
jgi:hypothetical protein